MMLVISPHLDDAVFGCANWLAEAPGSIVVTVFAGTPAHAGQLTDWDRRCGFSSADQAMAARREEDRTALALLGARPHWLPFCDAQYAQPSGTDDLVDALRLALQEHHPERVLLPLGLFHSDHKQVHDAAMCAVRGMTLDVLAYEDALYRRASGLLQRRLADLLAAGVIAAPAREQPPEQQARKAEAVQAYASQLKAFGAGGHEDTERHERCWRLEWNEGAVNDG
jgi:LmbE family N-acetylglucosaminyl deacetylase